MVENRTRSTAQSVEAFLATVDDPVRQADARQLLSLMERLSGKPAVMWGPSIIGFGAYAYRYDSGHGGHMARIGFSPRKRETVLYVVDGLTPVNDLLARLGPHRAGKSCLYVKRLADIDTSVLEQIVARSLASMAERFPDEA